MRIKLVTKLSATDFTEVTWQLKNHDYLFQISSSGDITFKSPPDFENPTDQNGQNIYKLNYVATESDGDLSN